MADAELNPEETPETPAEDQAAPSESTPEGPPSALEVLDRIEAEKAEAAGVEKPAEAEAAKPAEAEAAKPAEAEAVKPEPDPKSAKERDIELLKTAIARCEEIKQEVRVHDKAIKELNDEYVKLVRDIKHARERTRPPLHELNKAQAKITADERAQRLDDAETLRRLGAAQVKPRTYPPKFKAS